jgi:hypothetical protein
MSTELVERPVTLFDIPGCEFTPTSLTLPEHLPYDHWSRIGRQLQLADLAVQWWIGDWLIYGEGHYEDRYAQAIEETGRAKKTLQNYAYVAKAIPDSRRRESVDFSTHAEVASLEPEQQERILARAAKEKLTKNTVRREAERVKRASQPKPKDDDLILSKEARAFLDRYMAELAVLAEEAPEGCLSVQSMVYWHGHRAQWQKNRTRAADYEAISQVFSFEEGKPGLTRAKRDEISSWLENCGFFMSDSELNERLDAMVEERKLEVKSVEDSRQEGRRGTMVDLYALHPDYEAELESAA